MTSGKQDTRPPDQSARAGRSAEPDQPPTPSRADDAGDIAGKDAVQIGSEESFPASDPPSWMGMSHLGGREEPERKRDTEPGRSAQTGAQSAAPPEENRPHIPVEPPRSPPSEPRRLD